jgi:hypothetical protein
MRIAQIAPLTEAVPPQLYGGTERYRASAPRITCRTCCLRANRNSRPPAISDLSWLNPTPHAIAVYASQPLSPVSSFAAQLAKLPAI